LFLAFNEDLKIGVIPSEFGKLSNLVDLSLQKTNRIGAIPSQIGGMTSLVMLDLNHNLLTDTIPYQLGELTDLKFLLLKENDLEGDLPTTLSQLTDLDTLLLDDNGFWGGSSNVCGHLPVLTTFIADCERLGPCDCCTKCCAASDPVCNTVTWFSGLDPVATDNYARDGYLFHEDDIVYPVHSDVVPDYYQNFTGYSPVDEVPLFDLDVFDPTGDSSGGNNNGGSDPAELDPTDGSANPDGGIVFGEETAGGDNNVIQNDPFDAMFDDEEFVIHGDDNP